MRFNGYAIQFQVTVFNGIQFQVTVFNGIQSQVTVRTDMPWAGLTPSLPQPVHFLG